MTLLATARMPDSFPEENLREATLAHVVLSGLSERPGDPVVATPQLFEAAHDAGVAALDRSFRAAVRWYPRKLIRSCYASYPATPAGQQQGDLHALYPVGLPPRR